MFRYVLHGAVSPGFLSRIFHPSIDRLRELGEEGTLLDEGRVLSRSHEFSSILRHVMIGGVYKRTNRNRLPMADRALCAQLRNKHFGVVHFLDVGASDGVTTLDTVNHLSRELGVTIRAVLVDQSLWILRMQKGWIVEYVTNNEEPILVRLGPLALMLNWSPTGPAILQQQLAKKYLQLKNFRSRMRLMARISLLNPIVAEDSRIRSLELDVFQLRPELTNSMNLIRASNLLNFDYFSAADILTAIKNLHSYLHCGGFLLVSRNADESNGEVEHGSIWSKTQSSFEHELDFGKGAEIKELVNGFSAKRAFAATSTLN